MVATLSPSRRAARQPRKSDAIVAAETQALLTQEIWFVPSGQFKRLDIDAARDRPAAADAQSTPTPQTTILESSGGVLSSMCKTPLLTPSEERELFCRMNFLKYRANCLRVSLSPERPDRGMLSRIKCLLAESLAIRNRIIEANVRLVMSIVKQFADRRNRFDDLFSEGMNCLVKTVEKFDFDRGFRFSTYATRAVRREIFRLVQRQHRDRGRYSSGAEEILDKQIERGIHPEGVLASWHQLDDAVRLLMDQLDEREKFIVSARYGFDDVGEKPTFQRLGEMLGVSKERARQLEQRAIQKMRVVTEAMKLESSFEEA